MKKIITFMLVLGMCLSVLTVTVSASGSQIIMMPIEGKPGDDVTVPIKISGNPGVAYLKLSIQYDKNELRLVSVSNDGLLKGIFATSPSLDVSPYAMNWTSAENSTGDGQIASITFHIAETATAGTKDVILTCEECYNQNLDDVTFSTVPGKISVKAPSCSSHSFGEWTVKEATCNEKGSKSRTCSVCGHVDTKEIPAKGHTEVIDKAKAATCTESGLKEGKHCSVCNKVITKQVTVPAKGHTEVVDKSKAATCTEKGLTDGKHCSICKTVLAEQKEIPAKGHTEVVDKAKEPTATETGLTEGKHCSVCNTVLIKQEVIPAKGTEPTKPTEPEEPIASTVPMYRLYNPYTQEHLLSDDAGEKDALVSIGWKLDGVAWNAPTEGEPVYRLYNPFDDWHTYTRSQEEIKNLTALGWKVDGMVTFSASEEDGIVIFRLFNPYVQKNYHLLTASTEEWSMLLNAGWQMDGGAWYAAKP